RRFRLLPALPLEFTLRRGLQESSGTGQVEVIRGVARVPLPRTCACDWASKTRFVTPSTFQCRTSGGERAPRAPLAATCAQGGSALVGARGCAGKLRSAAERRRE